MIKLKESKTKDFDQLAKDKATEIISLFPEMSYGSAQPLWKDIRTAIKCALEFHLTKNT